MAEERIIIPDDLTTLAGHFNQNVFFRDFYSNLTEVSRVDTVLEAALGNLPTDTPLADELADPRQALGPAVRDIPEADYLMHFERLAALVQDLEDIRTVKEKLKENTLEEAKDLYVWCQCVRARGNEHDSYPSFLERNYDEKDEAYYKRLQGLVAEIKALDVDQTLQKLRDAFGPGAKASEAALDETRQNASTIIADSLLLEDSNEHKRRRIILLRRLGYLSEDETPTAATLIQVQACIARLPQACIARLPQACELEEVENADATSLAELLEAWRAGHVTYHGPGGRQVIHRVMIPAPGRGEAPEVTWWNPLSYLRYLRRRIQPPYDLVGREPPRTGSGYFWTFVFCALATMVIAFILLSYAVQLLTAMTPVLALYLSAAAIEMCVNVLATAGALAIGINIYNSAANSYSALLGAGHIRAFLATSFIGAIATIMMMGCAIAPPLLIPLTFTGLSYVTTMALSLFVLPAAAIATATPIIAGVATAVIGLGLCIATFKGFFAIRDWSMKKIYAMRNDALGHFTPTDGTDTQHIATVDNGLSHCLPPAATANFDDEHTFGGDTMRRAAAEVAAAPAGTLSNGR